MFLLMLRLLPVVCSFTSEDRETAADQYYNITGRLYDDLFSSYNKNLPAVVPADKNDWTFRPVFVNTSLKYCKILAIDQAKQTATMIIDYQTEWIDPRLKWDPANYSEIRAFTVAKEDTVWLPDALPFDTLEFQDTLPEDLQTIYNNGRVLYYRTTVTEFICRLKLNKFPFDTQVCELKLSSFAFPASEMTVTGLISRQVHSKTATSGNGEWTLLNITAENRALPGEQGANFSIPVFVFTIKRSTTYYVVMMIVPSFIMTFLAILGLFWEEVHAGCYMENLNLGFAAILAMMFVLQMVTQDMPKINETDRLSCYLMANLGLITLASLLVMVMGKMNKRKSNWEKKAESKSWPYCSRTAWKVLIPRYLHVAALIVFGTLCLLNFVILVG